MNNDLSYVTIRCSFFQMQTGEKIHKDYWHLVEQWLEDFVLLEKWNGIALYVAVWSRSGKELSHFTRWHGLYSHKFYAFFDLNNIPMQRFLQNYLGHRLYDDITYLIFCRGGHSSNRERYWEKCQYFQVTWRAILKQFVILATHCTQCKQSSYLGKTYLNIVFYLKSKSYSITYKKNSKLLYSVATPISSTE